MPVRRMTTLASVVFVWLVGGCGSKTAPPAAVAPPPAAAATQIQLAMLTKVNPAATALWDITAKAQDDNGDLLAAKLDAPGWTKLLEAGKALDDAGRLLATSTAFVAAAPGSKLQNEESPVAPKAADVQRYVDARPDEFRRHAAELQRNGASIVAVVNQRDGKALGELANTLYETCENCHKAFWYPEQKEPQ